MVLDGLHRWRAARPLASAWAAPSTAAARARPGAQHRVVSPPSESAVTAWLDRLRVDERAPESSFRHLLRARRHAGASDLARFAAAAVHAHALIPNRDGGWSSRVDAGVQPFLEVNAPSLAGMWRSLLSTLTPDATQLLAVLESLGGTATARELEALRPTLGTVAALARLGLIDVVGGDSGGAFRLPSPVLTLLGDATLSRAALPPLGFIASRLVVALVMAADAGPRLMRRALADEDHGRWREAAWSWERIAATAAAALDSREAGRAYSRAAAAAANALGDAPDRASPAQSPFALAALAVKHAEVAADREIMNLGLAVAQRVAAETPGLRLLEARVSLSLGHYAAVEQQLGAVLSEPLDTRESAEWWLLRGAALALVGEPAHAGDSLREAQRLGQSLGDVGILHDGAELAGMAELASTVLGLLESTRAHRDQEGSRIEEAEAEAARSAENLRENAGHVLGDATGLAREVLGSVVHPDSRLAASAEAPLADSAARGQLTLPSWRLEDLLMGYLTAIGADAVAVVASSLDRAGSTAHGRRVLACLGRPSARTPSLTLARALAAVPPAGVAWQGLNEAGAVAIESERACHLGRWAAARDGRARRT